AEETMADRLKEAMKLATKELEAAANECDSLMAASDAAVADHKRLTALIRPVRNAAQFVKDEVASSEKRAAVAVEAKKRAERRVAQAQSRVDDLRLAEKQLKAAGLLK